MAIFNGKNLSVEIYGQSHADKIGVKVGGMPIFSYDREKLSAFLKRRQPSQSVFSTPRKEADKPIFIGMEEGLTSNEFTAEILNTNTRSQDYNELYGKPRPSHADYCAYLKDGTLDFRGGGRFSGRLTAPLCVVGGILKQYLESKGIRVHAYISQIGKVKGRSYLQGEIPETQLLEDRGERFPTLANSEQMLEEITKAKLEGDSVGGIIECIIYGMPTGIGDNLFQGLEGKISSLVYSIPAVKGVEFGIGFGLTELKGSQANDNLYIENGKIGLKTNNAGGINGGISNGEQITLRVAVRPTPSISKTQQTVDLINKTNVEINVGGRHDSCIVPRAVPCVESAVCIAIADEIIGAL